MAISLALVLVNLLYLNPKTIEVMFSKHQFEKKIDAGQTVGKVEDEKLNVLSTNTVYVTLSKKFIILHSLASIGNLIVFCAQGVHLFYLAGNLHSL